MESASARECTICHDFTRPSKFVMPIMRGLIIQFGLCILSHTRSMNFDYNSYANWTQPSYRVLSNYIGFKVKTFNEPTTNDESSTNQPEKFIIELMRYACSLVQKYVGRLPAPKRRCAPTWIHLQLADSAQSNMFIILPEVYLLRLLRKLID